jgi:hypothetical protein
MRGFPDFADCAGQHTLCRLARAYHPERGCEVLYVECIGNIISSQRRWDKVCFLSLTKPQEGQRNSTGCSLSPAVRSAIVAVIKHANQRSS